VASLIYFLRRKKTEERMVYCREFMFAPHRNARDVRPRGVGKSKLDAFKEEIVALLRNGSSKKFVADRYGTSQVNLYNLIKKNNLNVTCQKACE
jgi:hypothetical protein